VYYIQYAHARICSVLSQWNGDTNSLVNVNLNPLTTAHETALMQRLSEYPEVVANAATELAPHVVANYLKELASDLHSYYNEYKFLIEDEQLKLARLSLISATQQVLKNGLDLLGVAAKERM
jgi:arginyl-tRNA synthetase